jgi:predicted phosphodiesterase
VRLLLLSDIHGNLEALEACLDAAPDYDGVANLGDVVGYGASPNQSVEMVRAMDPISVRGNHDRCCCGLDGLSSFNPIAAEAALWTRRELSGGSVEWLRQLPRGPVCHADWEDVQFVHGSPLHEDIYIASELAADAALGVSPFHITFFGHSHIQGAFAREHATTRPVAPEPFDHAARVELKRLKLKDGTRYLVNPGSVGQPRDHDRRAAFALYDSDRTEVRFYRVSYDIARAQERILAAGLPKTLALRLESGR